MNHVRVKVDPRVDQFLRAMAEANNPAPEMEFSPEEEDLLTATPQQIEMRCNEDGEYVAYALRFYK